jgi:hypothetical protein
MRCSSGADTAFNYTPTAENRKQIGGCGRCGGAAMAVMSASVSFRMMIGLGVIAVSDA